MINGLRRLSLQLSVKGAFYKAFGAVRRERMYCNGLL